MGAESVLSDSACTWALQLIDGVVASLGLNGSAAFGKTTLDLRSDTLMHVPMHTPAQLHPRTRCMLVKLTQQSSRKQGSEAGSQYLRKHFIHAVDVTVILLVVIYQSGGTRCHQLQRCRRRRRRNALARRRSGVGGEARLLQPALQIERSELLHLDDSSIAHETKSAG